MRTKFEYTDKFVDSKSEVVAEVFYNRISRQLAVNLVGGNVYIYTDVSLNEYLNFQAAPSRGKFYAYNIKNLYKRAIGTTHLAISRSDFDTTPAGTLFHQPVAPAGEPTFEVAVELNGTLTIKGTALSGDDALRKVQETLNETFKGTSKVKELKQYFI